jgi:hypothetical protein
LMISLRGNAKKATPAINDAIFWLDNPSDQTILLALHFVDILVFSGCIRIPSLSTNSSDKIVRYVRRVFTVATMLAEFRLFGRYPPVENW